MTASQRDSIIVQTSTLGATEEDGAIRIYQADLEAPWRWLQAGWADIERAPGVSLAYGAIFTVIALLLLVGLSTAGLQSMIFPLAGGFLLIGPVLAVGLYESSRRLAAGEPVSLHAVFDAGGQSMGQLMLFGLALMLIYLAWVELAFLLFMLFYGGVPLPPLQEFIASLLFTWNGLGLLIVGSIIGAGMAALVFTISMVSVPMLMTRKVGVATAVLTSVQAVRLNYQVAALWTVLIVGLMSLGIATLFVGIVIAFPLVGHASWHAYRDIVTDDSDDETAVKQASSEADDMVDDETSEKGDGETAA
ncbi:MAG: DUF2189 domain-containing protein [Alphaproteobacteria bacterium]